MPYGFTCMWSPVNEQKQTRRYGEQPDSGRRGGELAGWVEGVSKK